MEEIKVLYIKPQGSTLERALIRTLNFVNQVVYEKIVKPNSEKLETNIADTNTLKTESVDTYEQLLDTQFELETTKDDLVDTMESQLDLEFRVSQLEDSIES